MLAGKRSEKILLSIIIPCFNEGKRLPKRFSKLKKILPKLKNSEIIFVDDGSKDNTKEVLKSLKKTSSKIKFISYEINHGKGFAVKKGVEVAKGKHIGFTDADFSFDLDNVKTFVEKLDDYDIVIADRNSEKTRLKNKPSFARKVLGNILARVNNYFLEFGVIKDSQCGFKFFNGKVAKDLFPRIKISRWLWDIELLKLAKKSNYKILSMPIDWEDIRGSKVNITKDLIPVGLDLIRIYLRFFNVKVFAFITFFITSVILLPFLLNPQSLTKRSGDFSDMVWPNFYFIKEHLFKGEVPLWNPNIFSGIPEIANPQTPLYYPVNYLAFLLPMDLGIVLSIIVNVIIAAIFGYLIGERIFKWNSLASVTFSYGVVFSPFVWGKLAVGHLSLANAIFLSLPVLYFSLNYLKNFKQRNIFWVSLFLGFQYLNHPTHWYYTVLFGSSVVLALNFKQFNFRKLVLLISAPLSLVMILPIFLIQIKAGTMISRTAFGLSDLAIPIFSFSRFLRSVAIPSNLYSDFETEVWLYPGIILLIIAFLGWLRLKTIYKLIGFLVVTSVCLITLGGRTPVFQFLNQYLPGFSNLRVSTRDWFVLIVSLSFLGGYFIARITGNRIKFFIFSILLIDLILFSALRIWFIPDLMKPKNNLDLQKLLVNNSGRYYCTNRCLSASWTEPLGISTADGYHILILNHYRDALSEAGGFLTPKYTGNLPTTDNELAQPNAEKLGEFAVKWVISKNSLNDQSFKIVKTEGKYSLYENLAFKPRIRFEKKERNRINVIKDMANYIKVESEGDEDKLIIADSFYPNWRAFIDGDEVELVKFNGWARSVKVPSGKHLVEFKFNPLVGIFNI